MLAALGLAAAGVPCQAGGRVLRVALCGGHGSIDLPLPGKRPPAPDCAQACHAACPRRTLARPAPPA